MKNRSELRELIMKIIYQVFIYDNTNISYSMDELIKEQIDIENDYVNDMVHGILENKKKLFEMGDKYLTNWQMNRLNKVDQAIMCIGIYELLNTNTPAIVAINEAVELAKKYSEEKVVKMINGILDNIYHSEEYYE